MYRLDELWFQRLTIITNINYFLTRILNVYLIVYYTVVGIATRYGLDGPGIESRKGGIFRIHPDRPWDLPSPPVQWVPALIPGDKAAGSWLLPLTPIYRRG